MPAESYFIEAPSWKLVELLNAPPSDLIDEFLNRPRAARELVNRKNPYALPYLLAVRDDPDRYVRIQVARAMVHLGAAAEVAIPILRAYQSDSDELVRCHSEWALSKFDS